jgi:hypothetical protein
MQNQTAPAPHGVPESFYSKFGQQITAVLSGFDRIRFRGTLRMLYQPGIMEQYLGYCGVLIKNFKSFAESTTAKVKAAAYRAAALAGRPLEYLPNAALSKEELARELARRDKIKQGLIAIFTASLGLGVARSSWIFAIANSFRKMVSGDKNRRQTAYSPLKYEANSFAMRSSEGEFP